MAEKEVPSNKIQDPLNNYLSNYTRKTKLLVSLVVIGLVLFLTGAAVFPFKDRFFNSLYPKKQSEALEILLAPRVSTIRYGFFPWGMTYEQASAQLGSPNSYSYNLSSASHIYIIGKGSQMWNDPSNLKILMDNNLDNASFSNGTANYAGLLPTSWTLWPIGSGTAFIDTDTGTPERDNKVVKITAPSTNVAGGYTQITQTYKRAVTPGQWVIFGVWAKSSISPDLPNVSVFLQNPANSQPFPNPVMNVYSKDVLTRPGSFDAPSKIYRWTFVTGYVQVPAGVSNFQLVLKVTQGSAWFDGAAAAVIDSGANGNTTIQNLVSQRLGSAWFIDNEEGVEESCYVGSPEHDDTDPKTGINYDPTVGYNNMHIRADYYALLYHQFYKLIKKYDPTAMVMPGGLAGNSAPWDGGSWTTYCDNTQYSPKQYLDTFRTAYKDTFKLSGENTEPPVDAIGIHYYENDIKEISTANKFKTYMQNLRTYMDGVAGWQGKPIWLNEFGTRQKNLIDASGDHSAEFAQNALTFLKNNPLNIQKWFWFDTCGYNNVAPLFEIQSVGVCKKDISGAPILTNLGKIWANQDKGPIKVNTSIQVQDKIQVY